MQFLKNFQEPTKEELHKILLDHKIKNPKIDN